VSTESMTDEEFADWQAATMVRGAQLDAEAAEEAAEEARRHVVTEIPDDATDEEFMAGYEAGMVRRGAQLDTEDAEWDRATEELVSAAAAKVRWVYRRDVEQATRCRIVDAGDEVTLKTPRFHPGLARAAKGLYGFWRPAASGRGGVWVFERSYVDRVYSLAETFYR
jgi:hypothetical protein